MIEINDRQKLDRLIAKLTTFPPSRLDVDFTIELIIKLDVRMDEFIRSSNQWYNRVKEVDAKNAKLNRQINQLKKLKESNEHA